MKLNHDLAGCCGNDQVIETFAADVDKTPLTTVLSAMLEMDANITAQMQQMNANFNAQMQQMNTNLTAQFQQLNARLDDVSNRMTFSLNTTALITAEGSLLSFPNANNITPDIFPHTTAQFLNMTGPQLQALLQAYNVQNIPHALEARRARARQLITTGL